MRCPYRFRSLQDALTFAFWEMFAGRNSGLAFIPLSHVALIVKLILYYNSRMSFQPYELQVAQRSPASCPSVRTAVAEQRCAENTGALYLELQHLE